MKKKVLRKMALCLGVALMFAGCGTNNGKNQETAKDQETEQGASGNQETSDGQDASDGQEDAGQDAGGKDVTLNLSLIHI